MTSTLLEKERQRQKDAAEMPSAFDIRPVSLSVSQIRTALASGFIVDGHSVRTVNDTFVAERITAYAGTDDARCEDALLAVTAVAARVTGCSDGKKVVGVIPTNEGLGIACCHWVAVFEALETLADKYDITVSEIVERVKESSLALAKACEPGDTAILFWEYARLVKDFRAVVIDQHLKAISRMDD